MKGVEKTRFLLGNIQSCEDRTRPERALPLRHSRGIEPHFLPAVSILAGPGSLPAHNRTEDCTLGAPRHKVDSA